MRGEVSEIQDPQVASLADAIDAMVARHVEAEARADRLADRAVMLESLVAHHQEECRHIAELLGSALGLDPVDENDVRTARDLALAVAEGES
jgi:hypothetical protein